MAKSKLQNAMILDENRFKLAKQMPVVQGGPMNNNPMNVTSIQTDSGSLSGFSQYPYGDMGVAGLAELGIDGKFILLEKCPPVLSTGRLVEDHGFQFHWKQGSAWFVTPDGRKVKCAIKGYVPMISSLPTSTTTRATSATQVIQAETNNAVTPAAMAVDHDMVQGGRDAPAAQPADARDAATGGQDRAGVTGERIEQPVHSMPGDTEEEDKEAESAEAMDHNYEHHPGNYDYSDMPAVPAGQEDPAPEPPQADDGPGAAADEAPAPQADEGPGDAADEAPAPQVEAEPDATAAMGSNP